MNTEHAHSINGVDGRMFARLTRDAVKGTFSTQTWGASRTRGDSRLSVHLRFDDDCGNGRNTFAATATEYVRGRDVAGGCMHEEIADWFPELAPLLKWHLTSTDGPMHYPANVLYFAGDKDCWGLRKGERRQRKTNKGTPMWELTARIADVTVLKLADKYVGQDTVPVYALETLHAGDAPPATPVLQWGPSWQVGEGKARELDNARSAAVWPEATDAQLCADDLRQVLEARLPQLLADFRAAVESCGFAWEAI